MRVAVEDVAKKLTLWHTRTFRPIPTHDELEPILEAAGFVPLPMAPAPPGAVAWRAYAFRSGPDTGRLPVPRLPFPRLDGLHLLAYRAFFEALEHYLGEDEVPNLFHVRSMSITRAQFDRSYRPMKDCNLDNEGFYLYREGTLDQITQMACNYSSEGDNNNSSKESHNTALIGKYKNSSSISICLVPLKDLFPSRDIVSLG